MSEPQLNNLKRTAPVSVIIPVYNGERFIREAIQSVQAQTLVSAAFQTVADYEAIACDHYCGAAMKKRRS